jgi:serine/threonine protein kinase
VVRPDYASDDEFRHRFRNEISAAQRVQGLYTAPVIDADPDAVQPWLATAYVPGPSLQQAVREHGPMPEPTVVRLLAGVAEALISIHRAGLVHRDLKPANVLLAEDGPRVIDFGIVHALDATSLTRTGARVGTPAFMSPEQVLGRPVIAATDVFAVGHLMMFAATGHPAFGEGPTEALLFRIATQPPDLDQCPPSMRDLAARCLAKEPAERPSPTEIIEWCRERLSASADELAGSWLPAPLTHTLTTYDTAVIAHREPSPLPHQFTEPPPDHSVSAPQVFSAQGAPLGTWPERPSRTAPAVLIMVTIVAVAILASAVVATVVLTSNRSQNVPAAAGEQSSRNDSAGEPAATTTAPADPVATQETTPPQNTASSPGSTGYLRYNEGGFSVSVPASWTRQAAPPSVNWAAPDGSTMLQIDERNFDSPYTAHAQAAVADSHARANARIFPGYSLVDLTDLTFQDGAATDWEFTFDDPKGAGRIHAKDRFFYAGGKSKAIYLRAPASSWATMQIALDHVYTTFNT